MSSKSSYDGPALDGTIQYISERPELDQEDELVYATEPEPPGRESAENVPVPVERPEPVHADGQTTLERWAR